MEKPQSSDSFVCAEGANPACRAFSQNLQLRNPGLLHVEPISSLLVELRRFECQATVKPLALPEHPCGRINGCKTGKQLHRSSKQNS
jgi:hypothetical protein